MYTYVWKVRCTRIWKVRCTRIWKVRCTRIDGRLDVHAYRLYTSMEG